MRIAKGKRITANDVRVLARFRIKLELTVKLELEGHSRECAILQVFSDGKCGCEKEGFFGLKRLTGKGIRNGNLGM
jgi:hypothetical protein